MPRIPSIRKLLDELDDGACVGDWVENKFAKLLLTKLAELLPTAIGGDAVGGGPLKSSPPKRSSRSKLEATGAELGLLFVIVIGIESNVSNPPRRFNNEFCM